MTDQEKAIDRARKLLELSRSDNVNESAAALAQAQKLMSKHSITELMLSTPETELDREQIEDGILHKENKPMQRWKGQLAMPLCEANQCQIYRIGAAHELHVIGRPSDAQTVRYLFSYISNEITRLCMRASGIRGNPGVRWRNDFCIGAAQEVGRRVKEAAKEARTEMKQEAYGGDSMGNGTAIVCVNNALAKLDERKTDVERWTRRNLQLRKQSTGGRQRDYEGRAAGKRAGGQIDLSKGGRGSLGSGARGRLAS